MITKHIAEAIKSFDPSSGRMEAWISTEAIDRDGEVLIATGADLTNFNKNRVVLFAHDPKLVVAKDVGLYVVPDQGIVGVPEFAPTMFASEVKTLYGGGFLNGFSIGGQFIEYAAPIKAGQKGRTVVKWELWEYSCVAIPANPEALAKAATEGSDLAGLLLRHYCPEAKDANEAARIAADLRRLQGAAESVRNFWRHDADAIDRKAVADAVASLEEVLQTKFAPEPNLAPEPLPEPDPAVGAPSDEAAVVDALNQLVAEMRANKETQRQAIAEGFNRARRARIGR